jgi:hypothetical protein
MKTIFKNLIVFILFFFSIMMAKSQNTACFGIINATPGALDPQTNEWVRKVSKNMDGTVIFDIPNNKITITTFSAFTISNTSYKIVKETKTHTMWEIMATDSYGDPIKAIDNRPINDDYPHTFTLVFIDTLLQYEIKPCK